MLARPVPSSSWCCGVDYPRVATGDLDAVVYGSCNPWDHVAGTVLLRELGGVVRTLDGTDYRPGVTGHRLVVAGSEQVFGTVVQAVLGGHG